MGGQAGRKREKGGDTPPDIPKPVEGRFSRDSRGAGSPPSAFVTIYACEIPDLAETCLEDVADGVLPWQLSGVIGAQPNMRFIDGQKRFGACRIDPPGPEIH